MRNPIRPKNLRLRFLPLYLIGLAVLAWQAPRPGAAAVALPLIAMGTALRAWGAGHLVKNDTLTTTGPYAHLRHPLYLGTLLVGTGFAIWVGGVVAVAILALLWPWFALRYFPRKEASESRRLEAAYGDRFRRYREAVPALWPRLRPYREAGPTDAGQGGWQLGRYDANNEFGTLLALSLGVLVFWLRSGVGGG